LRIAHTITTKQRESGKQCFLPLGLRLGFIFKLQIEATGLMSMGGAYEHGQAYEPTETGEIVLKVKCKTKTKTKQATSQMPDGGP
jgi:hypothetical protein